MYLYYCDNCAFLGKSSVEKKGSKCSKCGKNLILLPCSYDEWSSLNDAGKKSVLDRVRTKSKGIKALYSFERENRTSKPWTVTENGIVYGTKERFMYEEIDYVETKKFLGSGQFHVYFKDKQLKVLPYPIEQDRAARQAADYINHRIKSKKVRVNGQFVRHCKSCNKVFFFNDDDIKRNKGKQLLAAGGALSGLAHLGSFRSEMNIMMANGRLDSVVDFEKCPYCQSRDIEVFDENDFNRYQQQMDTSQKDKSDTKDPIDEVKRYKELLDQGIITPEEFETKKKQLLGL